MDDEFEALQPKAEYDDIGSKYRHVFASPLGREVLADLLLECHFGSILNPDNKIQVAEYNVGVVVLTKCGILNKMDVVNALLSVIPKK